jgi:hypothetical protein
VILIYLTNTELAIETIHRMVKTLDFDPKMLLLATNLAREIQNRELLHTILEALVTNTHHEGIKEDNSQGMTIVRYELNKSMDHFTDE